ncbi:YfiT family bacillithiol transferase [Paenibacillus tarimensis]
MDSIRYPIGQFKPSLNPSVDARVSRIHEIPEIVKTLRGLIGNLENEQIITSYRDGGWTIGQIVHHMADNDMNAYLRFKRALTEDEPVASSYREDLWAELSDYKDIPIEDSLSLLELLHRRFLILLNSLNPEEYNRKLRTEALGSVTLDIAVQRFVWHNRHHMAQIESLINKMGWRTGES